MGNQLNNKAGLLKTLRNTDLYSQSRNAEMSLLIDTKFFTIL